MNNKYVTILIIVFFQLYACSNPQDKQKIDAPLRYAVPQSYPLDTLRGYTVNPITGDSIQPIINQRGDTIITGKPILVEGKTFSVDSLPPPEVKKLLSPEIVPLNTNMHPLGKPKVVKAQSFRPNPDSLAKINFTLVNSRGDTIPTGVAIPVKGKEVPCLQHEPVLTQMATSKEQAQQDFQYFEENHGLPSIHVYDVIQDQAGNLWFATYGGAAKYDGTYFTKYDMKSGLPDNWVTSLLEDREGNLWFSTQSGGVARFDGFSFTIYSEKEGLPENATQGITEDRQGNLWIATNKGLTKFDGTSFTHYTTREGLVHNLVHTIYEDQQGSLWVGTFGGVSKFDGNSFVNYGQDSGLSNLNILAIHEDQTGNLWFGTNAGLNKFDGTSFTHYTTSEGLSGQYINDIHEDQMGNLWFATGGGGLSKFDGQRFTHFTKSEGLFNEINSILEDNNGQLWFGTLAGGVFKYNPNSYLHYSENTGLAHDWVSTILEDQEDNLWFGTWGGGITKFDGAAFYNYGREAGLSFHMINSLCEDRRGNLWITTYGLGVDQLRGDSLRHYSTREGLSGNAVTTVREDRKGNIWFGTWGGGLTKYDGKSFTHFTQQEGLSSNDIWSILEDKSGNLWIGTSKGFMKYDGQYFTNYTQKEGPVYRPINDLSEDQQGNIWLSMVGGKKIRFDGSTFLYFGQGEDHLDPDHNAESFVIDQKNHLWYFSKKGLRYLDLNQASDSLEVFTLDRFNYQNYPKGSFQDNSIYIDSHNHLWRGGANGLVRLDLNRLEITDYRPQVQLNYLEINEHFLDYQQLPDSLRPRIKFDQTARFYNYPLQLELPHYLNHLTFYFSGGEVDYPQQLRYSYKIEGIDRNWSAPSREPKADYRGLPYGRYTFQVRAMNENQQWGKIFKYPFTIPPPWWHTWWAWSLYALLLISTIILIVRIRTRGLKNRQKELEETVKNRTLELQESNEELVQLNEELHQKSEEITAQRDSLEEALQKLKAAQSQLVQSEKMSSLGQLTAGIAHEINNPVNFISANIDSLKANIEDIMAVLNEYNTIDKSNFEEKLKNIDQLKKDHEFDLAIEELDQLIQGISEGATRTTQIIQGLRTFSRLDEDVLKMTDIHENIDATLTLLQNRYKDRIEIIKDYGHIPKIEAYPGKLNQVFMNLLSNAIEAIEGEGVISIQTCLIGGEEWGAGSEVLDGKVQENTGSHLTAHSSLLITIGDSGSGMSEAVKERIFEPFFTTKDVGKGVGLGLSIVHSIVEKHGGRIEVESKTDQGTTFKILIPVRQEKEKLQTSSD